MSINYNEDAGETAGTMELDIEFVMISTIKKRVVCVSIVTVVE